jgi:hypothetical protein
MLAESLYRALYTSGFSRFVTYPTALVATGRSESYRTGFAPVEKQRLFTAHDRVELRVKNNFQYVSLISAEFSSQVTSLSKINMIAIFHWKN